VNWNILVTLGKEIKRDFIISVYKYKIKLTSKMEHICLKIGEPSSKAKYNI